MSMNLRSKAHSVFSALVRNSRGASATREVERLSRLSDAELARLGITREGIVRHAFRGYLGY